MSKIRVSVVGGGFKPPHQGHLDMIFDSIKKNHITIIAVGKGVRDGITRELSMNILAIYLNYSNLFGVLINKFIYTPFGFIVLNKRATGGGAASAADESATGGGAASAADESATGGGAAASAADESATGGAASASDEAITHAYSKLEEILVEVYDDMLVDTLLMEELHSETIRQIQVRIGQVWQNRREFIIKKSNSPIGLIFFIHGELSSYVKTVSTANLELVYYVGKKDFEERKKIFLRFEKAKGQLTFKVIQFENVDAAGGTSETTKPLSGTDTRNALIVIKEGENKIEFKKKLFNYLYTKTDADSDTNLTEVSESIFNSIDKTPDDIQKSIYNQKYALWLEKTNSILRYRKRNTLRVLGYALNGKSYKDRLIPPESTEDIFNYLF